MAREWAITIPGGPQFRLADLPYGRFQQIADKHGLTWPLLKRGPMTNMDAYVDLCAVVAELTETELPERPVTLADIDVWGEFLVAVEDDLPKAGRTTGPTEEDPTTNG